MSSPIVVDIPHKLGKAEARRRIENGMGRLADQIPGGGRVESGWTGDRLDLRVQAMNQEVSAHIDIMETSVRLEVKLPPALGFFKSTVEGLLRRKGEVLLEDKSK
jgi:putative polyhydroxyalkanoate system protein